MVVHAVNSSRKPIWSMVMKCKMYIVKNYKLFLILIGLLTVILQYKAYKHRTSPSPSIEMSFVPYKTIPIEDAKMYMRKLDEANYEELSLFEEVKSAANKITEPSRTQLLSFISSLEQKTKAEVEDVKAFKESLFVTTVEPIKLKVLLYNNGSTPFVVKELRIFDCDDFRQDEEEEDITNICVLSQPPPYYVTAKTEKMILVELPFSSSPFLEVQLRSLYKSDVSVCNSYIGPVGIKVKLANGTVISRKMLYDTFFTDGEIDWGRGFTSIGKYKFDESGYVINEN